MATRTRSTRNAPAAPVADLPVGKSFTDYVAAGDAARKLDLYKRQLKAFCALAADGGVELSPEQCKVGGAYRSAFEAFCKDHQNI